MYVVRRLRTYHILLDIIVGYVRSILKQYLISNRIISSQLRIWLAQEHLLCTNLFNWSNTPLATLYIQQLDALTNNIIRNLVINNQLIINALEAAGNSLETSSNVIKAVTEVNSNVVTCWNSFLSMQQQRFFK